MTTKTAPGRGWAYLGAALGGVVSVAANVAHSYVPPATLPAGTTPDEWTPELGAVLSAVIWPVFLFVAIEILVRIPWPDGTRWRVVRFGGLLPVALVAAVVSYRHMSGLLAHYAEDGLIVAIGPLAVDGLMVMAAGALVATARPAAAEELAEPAPAPTVAVRPAPVRDDQDDQDDTAAAPRTADYPRPALPADLLDRARLAAASHTTDTGRPITRDALRAALGISNGLATDLLAEIRKPGPYLMPVPVTAVPTVPAGPVNGHRPS